MVNRWSAGVVLACALAGCSKREPEPPASIAEASDSRTSEEHTRGLGGDSDSAKPQASSKAEYTFGFESREHQLWFHSGTDPQLYTVKSKDGKVLAEGVDDGTLKRDYPELHDIVHTGGDLIGIGY
jgi:hypothetical protein